MVRRISTTLAALAVGMLFYAAFTGVILERIGSRLIRVGCIHTQTVGVISQTKQPPPGVPIFGVRVPVSAIVTACVTAIAMPFVATFMHHHRRRRRYLNDECIECGRPIEKYRGRCPGCGVRIGPG
jgi:hypothetical protein